MIAFLTHDATPAPGWLAAIREAFALSEDVGAVFGPHLPRPGTSPMIARELTQFFGTFGDEPRIFGAGDASFLSNVNAAYRRACWEEIRFDDVRLQRGPGLRTRAGRASDVAQGVPPRRRRPARARLLAGRVHAPLLRRVPRAARDDRPRRAAGAALVAARDPRPGAGRPRVHARAGRSEPHALDRALGAAPRQPQGVRRPRLALELAARARAARDLARGHRRRER